MFSKKMGLRAGVATALAAMALTTSMSGAASASQVPHDGLCFAGPNPAPVYRNGDFARIYTIQVNHPMRVHKFREINHQTWAYGNGNHKPDGWTNARNFNRCVIS